MPLGAEGASIISSVGDVLTVLGQLFTFMSSNPLLLFFIGCSIVGVGFKLFHKGKKSVA